MSADGSLRTVL